MIVTRFFCRVKQQRAAPAHGGRIRAPIPSAADSYSQRRLLNKVYPGGLFENTGEVSSPLTYPVLFSTL